MHKMKRYTKRDKKGIMGSIRPTYPIYPLYPIYPNIYPTIFLNSPY